MVLNLSAGLLFHIFVKEKRGVVDLKQSTGADQAHDWTQREALIKVAGG